MASHRARKLGLCVQGPAVAKDHGMPLTPILVVDLRAVSGSECRHRS
jgi:hypothetical protein